MYITVNQCGSCLFCYPLYHSLVMKKSIWIAPSILAADFAYLGDAIQAAEAADADCIHVDVMDGHFVPNISIGPVVVKAVRRVTTLPLDVHLMITHPEQYIEAFADAGVDRLTVHPEVCVHLQGTLVQIRDLGVKAGVALNPSTTEDVLRYVLPWLDVVLVMTVNPGFGGQKLIPGVLPKISNIRRMLDTVNPSARISVDGGVNQNTAPSVLAHGADTLVAGSAIFKAPEGVAQAVAALRSCAADQ